MRKLEENEMEGYERTNSEGCKTADLKGQ